MELEGGKRVDDGLNWGKRVSIHTESGLPDGKLT